MTALKFIAFAFLLSTANAEELRPAVHPYLSADVIVGAKGVRYPFYLIY